MAKEFEYIKSKVVNDTDGFLDDYTMYKRLSDGKYIMIFGDKEMYAPENTEPDVEFDTQREADEWFNSYGEDESIDPEDLGLIDNISFDDVTKESKELKESSRSEMIDWIEDHWNTADNSDYLYKVMSDLGFDIEDDSDEDEGFYANLTNDELKRVIDILKGDTKPTDKEQANMIKKAIKSVGRVVDMKDNDYGHALDTFDVTMDSGDTFRVQIYKM